jgi:hypothetical protein
MPPENMQLRLRKSASPDRHGLEAMIFVTAVEIVYILVRTLEWEIWRNGWFVDFVVCYDVSYQNAFFLPEVFPNCIQPYSTQCIAAWLPGVRCTIYCRLWVVCTLQVWYLGHPEFLLICTELMNTFKALLINILMDDYLNVTFLRLKISRLFWALWRVRFFLRRNLLKKKVRRIFLVKKKVRRFFFGEKKTRRIFFSEKNF